MPIHFYLGKPGAAKSYRALKEVVDELVYGERVIPTNLPLKLPELNEYLQQVYPDKNIDLHDRVRILSEDETREFYLHRDYGVDFKAPADDETKRGARVDYGDLNKLRPVMYVIDEVHTFFDSRNWMGTGQHVTHYNSQHRKFGDEVFFITQFLDLVDKRLRGFSQDFTLVRNHKLERLLMFRGPPYFSASTYLTPPSMGSVATNVERFTLDLKLANCYDTTAGMGIKGRNKPQERRLKGLNPVWAIPAAAVVIGGLYLAPDLLTKGVLKAMAKGDEMAQAVTGGSASSAASAPSASSSLPSLQLQPHANFASPGIVSPQVYPTGYCVRGKRVIVQMSDGTTRTERDKELSNIERNSVTLDGKKLFLKGSGAGSAPARPQAVELSPSGVSISKTARSGLPQNSVVDGEGSAPMPPIKASGV